MIFFTLLGIVITSLVIWRWLIMMQLVIDIPEESYKNIKEQVDKRDYPDMQIGRAIANGIPLPKGHGRILDEKDILDTENNSGGCCDGYGGYWELKFLLLAVLIKIILILLLWL